jgi:FkbH-like protein
MALTDLSWLPAPPPDFRNLCRSMDEDFGAAVSKLARHALDLNQLTTLAKAIERARLENDLSPLSPMRLGLLGNGTTSLFGPALTATAARHGLDLEVVEAPYDQGFQAALDPASDINRSRPDAVLLAFDHRILAMPDNPQDEAESTVCVGEAFEQIRAIGQAVSTQCGATVIYQTLVHPPTHLLGSYDRRLPGSPHKLVDNFNDKLIESINGTGDILLDAGAIAEMVGLDTWHDITRWHLAKIPFVQTAIPLYADHVARLLAASVGKSRKCLVLDLDNTLWGGVIGDDGLAGIVLGEGDPVGEAFLDIQRMALQLRAIGVILAVSSKNEDATARLPFREHPDMIIREKDIAVFQANWSDKATNLESIANALDIGVDALVLLDDNPVERAQVRAALPQVAVPELPDDPALYPRTLLAAGYFETVSLSAEDLLRADDYTSRAKRVELQGASRDLSSYLTSLNMEIFFAPFDETGRNRIAQLINKSNQFNLTTRRYTQNEVAALEADPSVFTLQVRLRDRFGDNGMISVVICRSLGDGEEWEIDTWLMSCRVLARGVEQAVLAEIVRNAVTSDCRRLRGRFIPSGRNDLVRDHYANLGFAKQDDGTTWLLETCSFKPHDVPVKVIHAGNGAAS